MKPLKPLIETLSLETQALAAALRAHPYQGAMATHTVTTPWASFQVCRQCYAECLRTYPGVNSVASSAHRAGALGDGRCQCEHDKHFLKS